MHTRRFPERVAGQAFGVTHDVLVQVTRVRIEDRRLSAERVDHSRMAVTDRGHVVVAIEVFPPGGVKQPDPFPLDDV